MSESDFCDNIPSEMGIDEDVQHWLRFPESAMVSAETAEVLRVSPGTVKRDWKLARVWLLEEITGERGDGR